MVGPRAEAQSQVMRKHARHRLDLATTWPVVGTSLMMVIAGSHGFDDAELEALAPLAPAAAGIVGPFGIAAA
jgi:hypothetical protein